MKARVCLLGAMTAWIVLAALPAFGQAPADAPLPAGVRAVWDLSKAFHEVTPTRERVCINGLWRFQPAQASAAAVPAGNWGYFKVPGPWPGRGDYLMTDSQTLYPHPSWSGTPIGGITSAWYQREITIPAGWAGRRITLDAEYLNSFAAVYVDGNKVGEMRFPGGDLDLTAACTPGAPHLLSLLVIAMPQQAVVMSFSDTNAARQVQGTVDRRGLCGDVYLESAPALARLGDVKVQTSVRNWEITFDSALDDLTAGASYTLHAEITDGARQVAAFTSDPVSAADLKAGRTRFTARWHPARLWDTITPENQYQLSLSLLDAAGKAVDTEVPQRFGFREFWIDGRDFYLNGSRIFLSAVPFNNGLVGPSLSSYTAAKESLLRLKSAGINYVYGGNYGCEPGTHVSTVEFLRAADDVGMLVGLTQPHYGQYRGQARNSLRASDYTRDAAFFVSIAGSHPSVVMYPTSHNSAGYRGSIDPDTIDGLRDYRGDQSLNAVKPALQADAILNSLDPTRIVYHHAAGNLGAMHTNNFYTNFAPIQEVDDWFEHWATVGVKPTFPCEFGCPYTWDFTMYRGYFIGQRTFGSAMVPWQLALAEWNSQFLGDKAYQISEVRKRGLRWEAGKFKNGVTGWYRWDLPSPVGSTDYDEQYPVMAMYFNDEWRALRTWGVSALNPAEYHMFWKPRPGVDKSRKTRAVDWENIQRPGFSVDYVNPHSQTMVTAFDRSDWIPTPAAQVLYRDNMPLLAYIGGKPAAFTGKEHNFTPGETVEKQLIVINNARRTVTADCTWSLALPRPLTGARKVTIDTGGQQRIPLTFSLPAALAPGPYEVKATVTFTSEANAAPPSEQSDTFTINVLPRPVPVRTAGRIALFDPKGETAKVLASLGVHALPVQANDDLTNDDILIIGKNALTVDGPGPDVSRVRDGLKVVVFEQTADVMEKRFGFRTAEYGLRNVFVRVPGHPLVAGLDAANLHDWRGEATLSSPRLKYEFSQVYQGNIPTVKWCGIDVPRVYRCGCRGSVASVLIEKPAKGDFLPVIDGGFSLQYSPLMEYREGKGLVLFCQMDVSGRTEADPAAEALVGSIIRYAAVWKPAPTRTALYAGDVAGKRQLELSGIAAGAYAGGSLAPDQVLVVGSGGGRELAAHAADVAAFVKAGGPVLALGLNSEDANAFLPFKVGMTQAEHIAAYFEAPVAGSLLAGVGPADVQNRDPRELPLIATGATVLGDGVLAKANGANVLFCQLPPQSVSAAGGGAPAFPGQANLRMTYRRASFELGRLLGNLGVSAQTPLLARFSSPTAPDGSEKRWLGAFYIDTPVDWDDPYRFFGW